MTRVLGACGRRIVRTGIERCGDEHNFEKSSTLHLEHMNEEEFDKIEFQCDPSNCDHSNVKIYNLGMNTDFGCTKCGFCSTNRYAFQRKEGNGNNI